MPSPNESVRGIKVYLDGMQLSRSHNVGVGRNLLHLGRGAGQPVASEGIRSGILFV
jgi:hypothetical protein